MFDKGLSVATANRHSVQVLIRAGR